MVNLENWFRNEGNERVEEALEIGTTGMLICLAQCCKQREERERRTSREGILLDQFGGLLLGGGEICTALGELRIPNSKTDY